MKKASIILLVFLFCASCAIHQTVDTQQITLPDGKTLDLPEYTPSIPDIPLSAPWTKFHKILPIPYDLRLEERFNAAYWVGVYSDAGETKYAIVLWAQTTYDWQRDLVSAAGRPNLFLQEGTPDGAVHSWELTYEKRDGLWRAATVDYLYWIETMYPHEEYRCHARPEDIEVLETDASKYLNFTKQFWTGFQLPEFGTSGHYQPAINEAGFEKNVGWPESLEFNEKIYTFESQWDPILIHDWPIIAADPQPEVLLTGTGYCLVANPGMVDLPNVVMCELYGHTLISYAFFTYVKSQELDFTGFFDFTRGGGHRKLSIQFY